jgi:hypothetical protein
MKQKLFYQQEFENDTKLYVKIGKKVEKNYCQVTLMIPEAIHDFFLAKIQGRRSRKYLAELMQKYKYLLIHDKEEFERKFNLGYQKTGLDLQKVNIYADYETWAEAKQLKALSNWSCCRIFTFLVYLDWLGVEENLPKQHQDMVAPIKQRFVLYSKIYLNTKMSVYARRFYFRRFDFHATP